MHGEVFEKKVDCESERNFFCLETFLLRLARGSSLIGLAGIGPQLMLPQPHTQSPVLIVRPFLGFTKVRFLVVIIGMWR